MRVQSAYPRITGSQPRVEHTELSLRVIEGELPRGLGGHYFFVGPAGTAGGGRTPVFLGDGLIRRVRLGPEPSITSRVLRTPCQLADELVRDDRVARFRNVGLARLSPRLGFRNFGNTALASFELPGQPTRLLAGYDAARPVEVDPATLELATVIGARESWTPSAMPRHSFPLVMGTGHPAWDAQTHEMFFVNYSLGLAKSGSRPFTRLLRWTGESEPESWPLVDPAGRPVVIEQSVHQMAVSERWVLLMDTAFRVSLHALLPDPWSRRAPAQHPHARLWLVERAALSARPGSEVLARPVELEREASHFAVDHCDRYGVVVHAGHSVGLDLARWVRAGQPQTDGRPIAPGFDGLPTCGTDVNVLGRHVIDPHTGETSSQWLADEERTWGLGFVTDTSTSPHHDPARVTAQWWFASGFWPELVPAPHLDTYGDHPHRRVPVDVVRKKRWSPSVLFRLDVQGLRIVDEFRFPPSTTLSSPQFVPHDDATHAEHGFLIVVVWSGDDTELWIFDAEDLARGPLVKLGHPELTAGFTMHATWMRDAAPRASSYRVDPWADLVRGLPFGSLGNRLREELRPLLS
ncbi:MAG: carotenoid oxygenase family protein [Deltaproteobacteria bacterium]|nr:carotenoid oxygenase family protein [Deltaproteobacteria bacterium]